LISSVLDWRGNVQGAVWRPLKIEYKTGQPTADQKGRLRTLADEIANTSAKLGADVATVVISLVAIRYARRNASLAGQRAAFDGGFKGCCAQEAARRAALNANSTAGYAVRAWPSVVEMAASNPLYLRE
jgi:hypothetical protein